MITAAVLKEVFKRGTERFGGEYTAVAGGADTLVWVRVLAALLLVALVVVGALMARKCKDKGLNFAVVLIDPLAYILARLFFGRC